MKKEINISCDLSAEHPKISFKQNVSHCLLTVWKKEDGIDPSSDRLFWSISQSLMPIACDLAECTKIVCPISCQYLPKHIKNKMLVQGSNVEECGSKRCLFLYESLLDISSKTAACIFSQKATMCELVSVIFETYKTANFSLNTGIHSEKIEHAQKLISNDLRCNYSVPQLAKLVGTNTQYLKQYFKKYVGLTISEFTAKNKMNYAKSMLTSSSKKISEIAREVGYSHPTHFTTAFKRHFGATPNSLRS